MMKATRIFALVVCIGILACAQIGRTQGTPLYDPAYAGPMNVYGQPAFTPQQGGQGQNAQNNPYALNGPIPMAVRGAQAAGSYLWSYMPAPVRGVESPYHQTPGSGQVNVNFVPGAR